MEIVRDMLIILPNAVIISGLTQTEVDEDIETHLKTYGSISRVLKIDSPNSEFHQNTIVEFNHVTALESLRPLLPLTYKSPSKPDVTFLVRALDSVYAPTTSDSATKRALEELQAIAKLSGMSLQDFLQGELLKLQSPPPPSAVNTVDPIQSPIQISSPDQVTITNSVETQSPSPRPLPQTSQPPSDDLINFHTKPKNLTDVNSPVPQNRNRLPPLKESDITPPAVQMVVEHIVRTEDGKSRMYNPVRLRIFSGKCPRPNNEVDYDTWRNSVDLILKDPAISDLDRTRKIFDSLLSPAADIIKHLSLQTSPSAYVELLDSAYGTVEDGDELFAKFMTTMQDSPSGEKPSTYLQRLQVVLSAAMRRGGVSPAEFDRQLLKQFCRGCWDNSLITDLQLEHKIIPPSFGELLRLLRTEEEKQAAKVSRMKQHFGATKQTPPVVKQRIMSHLQSASPVPEATSVTDELKKEIAELRTQLANLKTPTQPKGKATRPKKVATEPEVKPVKQTEVKQPNPNSSKSVRKPRPWYCFQCGEDGHIKSSCTNEADPTLVATKRKELREKQLQWDAQNPDSEQSN